MLATGQSGRARRIIMESPASAAGRQAATPPRRDGRAILAATARTRQRRLRETLIGAFFQANGLLSLLVLVGILVFLVRSGMPAVAELGLGQILFGTRWNPSSPIEAGFGAAPMIVGSLMITAACLVIAVPWGIAVAAYIADVASPRLREILKPAVEVLAIFPSVVIGFVALVLLAPFIAAAFGLRSGLTALTGAIALSIMALPTIVSVSEDAITAVSRDHRDAAYALGANRWQTVRYVVIPAALSGIVAAVMLGFGRAIGETMTVLMATGNALNIPFTAGPFGVALPDYLESVRTLTATIAVEGLEVPWQTPHYHALFVLGAILFFMTFMVNLVADLILHRHGEKEAP